MAGYNPGDIFFDEAIISSPRTQSLNLARLVISGQIIETIFSPGVKADIKILDADDYLGKLKIAGDELFTFQFRKPNGGTARYEFHVNSIKESGRDEQTKYKIFTIDGISRETLTGQTIHIQKGYNATIEDIVKDLHQQMKTKLPLRSEATKGKRNFKINNQPVLHAIDKVRREAVSEKNKGSNYMFWLTHSGFWFKSLEGMLEDGDVRTFKQDPTVGHNMMSDVESNIIGGPYVKQNMDAVNRIHSGSMMQRVATFDIHTNMFVVQDIKPKTKDLKMLGKGDFMTDAFRQIFEGGMRSVFRMVNHNEDLKIDPSHVPDAIPYKMLNLAQMQEQEMTMTVFGDTILEAGKTIYNKIPVASSLSGPKPIDPQTGGRWLISKVVHDIRRANDRPRWVCHLECLKGATEESLG